jgi:predicted phage terminase large subunit-like protein
MSPARFAEVASKNTADPWKIQPHIELMNEIALKIAARKISRHMTMEPPQTGKSQFWTKWLITWLLGCFPDRRIILGCYNTEYAASWGEQVRDALEEFGEEFFGVKVRPDHRSKEDFALVGHRGGLRTMGMDAGITGKAADHFFIDDFMKGDEFNSPSARDKHWRVYNRCIETRIQPGGTVCITFTPWHEDDLAGRLLRAEFENWSVLRLPALAEEPEPEDRRNARVGYMRLLGAPDPLGREPGKALWPARYDEKHYARVKRLEPSTFDSLFQCCPRPLEGGTFKRAWFDGKTVAQVPAGATQWVRYWDKAASRGKGDYTVGVLMACVGDNVYVVDVRRDRKEPADRDQWIRETAVADKAAYGHVVTWGEHAGNDAKEAASAFIKNLVGFSAFTEGTGNRDKMTRAYPFASWCQSGRVFLVEAHWNESYIYELCAFTGNDRDRDDQVDASSGAFSKLSFATPYHAALAGPARTTYDPIALTLQEQGATW